jgi:acyl-homoserine-lactone acylase
MGVPHIKANDWGGVGYGIGYAQAQDNLCTIADSMLTYKGERSLYFGGDQTLPFLSTIGRPKNIDSDFFHRHVLNDDALQKLIAAQPDSIKQAVAGFAAGYNRYVREIKAGGDPQAHAACRNQAWIAPITDNDIFRRMYAANFSGGYSNFVAPIANTIPPAGPVGSTASTDQSTTVARQNAQRMSKSTQLAINKAIRQKFQVGGVNGIGSNMLGFGSAGTGEDSPLLLGNPHWYWTGPDRFYQAQLTIPGTLNVSGATFLGLPVILIGYNDNVAWSHTVSTAARSGLFQLKLAPGDPTSYILDGKAVKMIAHKITVQVRQADGNVSPVTRTLYETRYGPVINLGLINSLLGIFGRWGQSTAFAIRDVNGENFRLYSNWLRWSQAASLDEFINIQREEAAMPWVNTVAIGRNSSNAWYADIGAVPNVSARRIASCATFFTAVLNTVLPSVPMLDGSRSACDWESDPDSVQPGTLGPSRMPSLLRSDYVMNSNDSYWLANADQPLTGYPAIMGPAGTTEISFRSRLGHILAQERLAGTDGLDGNKATSETVRAIALNSRVLTAELFKDQVIALLCSPPSIITMNGSTIFRKIQVNPTEACAVLQAWDNKGTLTSRGAHIWDEFWLRASQNSARTLYAVPFDSRDPVNTPRGLKASAKPQLQQALGGAIQRIQASEFTLDAPRGDYLFATRVGQKIPLYGGCHQVGYYTVTCSDNRLDLGGYTMDNTSGSNSYMQVVRFPTGSVEAYTLLTFSQSDDPASPHNVDYTHAYSRGEWQKMPFSEAEITSDPALTVQGISE